MNINAHATRLPTSWFVNQLAGEEPFTFTRFGDGEWRTIIGGIYIGLRNSNGCTFSKKLSNELRGVLQKNKPYRRGILRIAIRQHKKEIEDYLVGSNCQVKWYKGDTLLGDSLRGNIFPFVEQLRERRILMVGQPFLRGLGLLGFFKPITFVHTPPVNAIEYKEEILDKVRRVIDRYYIDTVLWSSGLHTKIFVDELFDDYSTEITMIDCGSMWDGYMRIPSRTYIRRGKVKWNDLIEVNTGRREKKQGETFRK